VDNSSVITLAKNPVFYDRSKHIDTRFYYLWDFIANKKVKAKYVKTQDQVTNIFTKPLKYDVFIKMRDMLGVMKKSSLKGDVESNEISFLKNKEINLPFKNRLTGWNNLNWSTDLVGRILFLFRLGFPYISLIPWLFMTLCL